MSLKTVAILSPGDMGHAVGRVLVDHGLQVVTCLRGRSVRTHSLAERVGIAALPDYAALVRQSDIILSILVPAQAENAARTVARALRETGATPLYVDCNAISPDTVRRVGEIITTAGGRFADASIIGGPPRDGRVPRMYTSGPGATAFAALGNYGLDIRVMGDRVGDASALKMCYAALTKGLTALCTTLLVGARRLGISEALAEELRSSQSALYEMMRQGVPAMPMKARRWIGEMEEIAATFAGVGLTDKIHLGAAEMYRLVAATPLADRTPEDPSPLPSLEEAIALLAAWEDPAADHAG